LSNFIITNNGNSLAWPLGQASLLPSSYGELTITVPISSVSKYCRESNGEMSTADLMNEINRQLACLSQEQVDNSSKLALEFEPTVHLVTANYAKDENGTTSGVSIALVFNRDSSVSAPRDHFLNAELLNYFNDNHQVDYQFIEDDLPPKLQDYQLVAGTAEVREILPRELEVIDF
jgi:hypothetical protein